VNPAITVTQKQLGEFLLNVAVVRPVFIWGQPGIGKSALVQDFAERVGLPCVSLLGSQLAPEDIIGVPQIIDGMSRFCPPHRLTAIIKGDMRWPDAPQERDILYFLSQSFRAHLLKELPQSKGSSGPVQDLAFRAKAMIKELASINMELAQMVVSKENEQEALPAWFMVEVVRDLPRLVERKERDALKKV
jgi:hypothetical protein